MRKLRHWLQNSEEPANISFQSFKMRSIHSLRIEYMNNVFIFHFVSLQCVCICSIIVNNKIYGNRYFLHPLVLFVETKNEILGAVSADLYFHCCSRHSIRLKSSLFFIFFRLALAIHTALFPFEPFNTSLWMNYLSMYPTLKFETRKKTFTYYI